jgi:hypothetical protein
MFKKLLIGTLAAVIVVAAGASAYTTLAAPDKEAGTGIVAESVSVEPVPVSYTQPAAVVDTAIQTAGTALTSDEIAGLLYMFEEEKLARDVYNALYALWGQRTFQNIAASEQTHMDTVKVQLDSNGIAAPNSAAGIFSDPSLQALYNSLMATGSLSLADALKVGATIEEVDIVDLQSRIAQTANPDILMVYNNLLNGSYNHLRNFTTVLTRMTGEVYQPQYLSADLFQTIISSATGNGHGNGAGTFDGTTAATNSGKGYRGGR